MVQVKYEINAVFDFYGKKSWAVIKVPDIKQELVAKL